MARKKTGRSSEQLDLFTWADTRPNSLVDKRGFFTHRMRQILLLKAAAPLPVMRGELVNFPASPANGGGPDAGGPDGPPMAA